MTKHSISHGCACNAARDGQKVGASQCPPATVQADTGVPAPTSRSETQTPQRSERSRVVMETTDETCPEKADSHTEGRLAAAVGDAADALGADEGAGRGSGSSADRARAGRERHQMPFLLGPRTRTALRTRGQRSVLPPLLTLGPAGELVPPPGLAATRSRSARDDMLRPQPVQGEPFRPL